MGTRGFVAVQVDGVMHVTSNSMSSMPDCLGVDILTDVKELVHRNSPRQLVDLAAGLVDPVAAGVSVRQALTSYPGFAAHVADVWPAGFPSRAPDLNGTDDDTWHWFLSFDGLAQMLDGRLYFANPYFPVESGWAEWGYLLDLDRDNGPDRPPGVLEIYRGFQETRPVAGAWANRPTPAEEAEDYADHLAWCADRGRDPWMPPIAPHKACAPIAVWALDSLPDPAVMGHLNKLRGKTLDDTAVPSTAAGVVAGVGPVDAEWVGEVGSALAS